MNLKLGMSNSFENIERKLFAIVRNVVPSQMRPLYMLFKGTIY